MNCGVGDDIFTINGNEIPLDTPMQLIGERTYVPLRAVAQALGGNVTWEDSTKTAVITQ